MQSRLADLLRPQIQRHPRIVGIVMLALGVGLFWWSAYQPYFDALAHQRVRLFQVGIIPSLFSPFFVLFGLTMIGCGPAIIRRNASSVPSPPTARIKVLATLAVFGAWAILSAPFCAIMGRIEALGYDVGNNPVYYVSRHLPPLHQLAEWANRLMP